MRTLPVLLAVAMLLPVAGAASSVYTATGTFAAGNALAPDACAQPELRGITGSCAAVRSTAAGRAFSLSAAGTSPIVGLKVCFFTAASAPLACASASPGESAASGIVPAGAALMSVTATAGAGVSWFFRAA